MKKIRNVRSAILKAAAILIAAAAGVLAFHSARPGCDPVSGGSTLAIDSARVADKAAFYCYKDAGRKLRFILARGSDGKIRSVMDACEQCYPFHKGFTATGGELVCRLCGNRYPINHMLAGKASCVPVALPSREEGGRISIRSADVKKFGWLF